MSQTNDFNDAVSAIRSASALTEATFLKVGQSLEESIEILAKLTSRFETVLEDLEGDRLGQALEALTWTAAQVRQLGEEQLRDSARFDQMRCLTEAIAKRIAQMQVSLKDVDSLAVNSKIAAANIRASDMDFTVFAAEIGRTLLLARATLDRFAAELNILRRRVAAAHEGQLSFEKCQHEAARSITERLSATITSISQRNQRAAHASQEVKLGSGRVRQRICDAILALQIGDITRQRLEHADHALGLAAPAPGRRAVTDLSAIPALDADELSAFVTVSHRLQSAQMTDAANDFDRDVRQITESLNSLAAEARALRNLGDSAYGAEDRGGGTFITELEGQIGEALALFVDFQTARAEVAAVTATVSDATAGLCGHLRTVQSLEADIRIMGLNTTFKCARIGQEGRVLSVIAQELRNYANGFAREAGTLMVEVENVSGISGSLIGGGASAETMPEMSQGSQAMRDALATLRAMGVSLDLAVRDLERDSDRVVTLLMDTTTNLAVQGEIGQGLRDAAGHLAGPESGFVDGANLTPRVGQMLALIERGYTMANERAVHDRVFGRASPIRPVVQAVAAVDEFLF